MRDFYVYIIVDPSKNYEPVYVGKGTGNRAFTHLNRKDKHPLTLRLSKMRNKNIEPKFSFYSCESEELAFFIEEELIQKYGRKDKKTGPLLNLTDGGEGICGRIVTNETRKKLSIALRGKVLSEEHKQKLSKSGKGKKRSQEVIEKIRSCHIGKKRSTETCEKIKLAKQGQKYSETARENMSKGQTGKQHTEDRNNKIREKLLGHEVSAETRKKISEALRNSNKPNAMLGKKHSDETKAKISEAALKRHAIKRALARGESR